MVQLLMGKNKGEPYKPLVVPEPSEEEPPGLHIEARLALALESASKDLSDVVKAWRREQSRLNQLPSIITFEQLFIGGAATSGVVDMAGYGPQPGRTWIVRLLNAINSPLSSPTVNAPTNNHPANPAAATDITVTVPTGQSWTLQSFIATLTASATVANRIVNVQILDASGNVVFQWVSPVTQTAGQVVTYSGYPGAPNAAAVSGGVLTFNLPAITMGAGWQIKTVTTGLAAGDQWSAIDVSYLLSQSTGAVTWYVGQNVTGPVAGQLPATMSRWQFPSVPGFQSFTSNVIQLLPNQHLLAGLTGLPANASVALVAVVNEQPLYAQTSAVAVE